MKVALVEDELPALEHLERLLARVSPGAVVVARLRTVRQLRGWLADDGDANLVLADVQLGDGLSIDAFAGSARALPVVFVTAHDHFLTEALAADGIAYLLKPLREADLALALAKLARLERHFARTLGEVAAALSPATDRLVGRRGLDWVSVPVADVQNHHFGQGSDTIRYYVPVGGGPDEVMGRRLQRGAAPPGKANLHRRKVA